MSNNPYCFLMYIINSDYRELCLNQNIKFNSELFSFDKLIEIAEENKVAPLFASEYKKLYNSHSDAVNEILNRELEGQQILKKTILFIDELLTKAQIDYTVVKTYKGIPFSTRDLDIIVQKKDLNEVEKLINQYPVEESGGKFIKLIHFFGLDQPGYKLENMLDLDLYTEFPWPELRTIDPQLFFENRQVVNIAGVNCKIPRDVIDLLSIISSPLYTDREISILDYLYINKLLISNENLLEDASKLASCYGWNNQFDFIVNSILEHSKNPNFVFPYIIPIWVVTRAMAGPAWHKIKKRPKSFFTTIMHLFFNTYFGYFYMYLHKKIK